MNKFYIMLLAILIVIFLLFLIMFIISIVIYKKLYSKRFNNDSNCWENKEINGKIAKFKSGENLLKGYFYSNVKQSNDIVILIHGYGLTHRDYGIEIESLISSGFDVFAYDMTGCGDSEGNSLKGVIQFIIDAQNAIKYVSDLDSYKNISIFGHSTGAYAAAALLNEIDVKISKAIIVSGFNYPYTYLQMNMKKTFGAFSWFLKVFTYLIDKYRFGFKTMYTAVGGINKFNGKTFIIQGLKDEFVLYDKESIYSCKKYIKNKKVIFYLDKNGDHYLTRNLINGKIKPNKVLFDKIIKFLKS